MRTSVLSPVSGISNFVLNARQASFRSKNIATPVSNLPANTLFVLWTERLSSGTLAIYRRVLETGIETTSAGQPFFRQMTLRLPSSFEHQRQCKVRCKHKNNRLWIPEQVFDRLLTGFSSFRRGKRISRSYEHRHFLPLHTIRNYSDGMKGTRDISWVVF